jgi:hypothetical protein
MTNRPSAPAASGAHDERHAVDSVPGDRGAARVRRVVAEVLGTDRICAGGHFFADLGADSMMMARFCARMRKRTGLPARTNDPLSLR